MKILSKNGNELLLLAMKEDSAAKGDYMLIEDRSRSMVVQVYDEVSTAMSDATTPERTP